MSWIEENAERMYPDSDITYGVGAVREAYAYGANEALKRLAQPEVNSVEELDELPVESVVMDKHGYVYLLVDEDDEFKWSRNGLDAKFPSWGIVLPARVLNRPEVKP